MWWQLPLAFNANVNQTCTKTHHFTRSHWLACNCGFNLPTDITYHLYKSTWNSDQTSVGFDMFVSENLFPNLKKKINRIEKFWKCHKNNSKVIEFPFTNSFIKYIWRTFFALLRCQTTYSNESKGPLSHAIIKELTI